MKLRAVLLALLPSAALHAQDGPTAGFSPATPDPQLDRVLVDVGDGDPAACADSWKAEFPVTGPRFVPFFGSRARTDHPLDLHLREVTVAGVSLAIARTRPVVDGEQVRYLRGGFEERYELDVRGLEQSFHFEQLPERGELVVTVDCTGEYRGKPIDGDIEFDCDEGAVRYGRAVAIDADGRREAVTTRLDGDTLQLVVPAAFVASARLPLIVDPMISTVSSNVSYLQELRSLDISYSGFLSRYVVCYERVWSQTDSDVFAMVLDGLMHEPLAPFVIDISATSWRNCAIAGLRYVSKFLTVAEVSTANASPFSIRGRMLDLSSGVSVSPAFEIASPSIAGMGTGDRIHPDVGGDPYPGQVWFTVVWERVYSSTDHDIQVIQVAPDSTLRMGTYATFDTSLDLDNAPHISKSDGMGDRATQGWAVVWRRDNGVGSGHYRAGVVHDDGTLRTFGFNNAKHLAITATSPTSDATFDVSSPTEPDLGRRYLLLERRLGSNGAPDQVLGTVFDRDLFNIVPSMPLFSGSANPGAGAIRSLSVDCEGCRFSAVSTHAVSATDDDVEARTFAILGNTLVQHDLATVAATPDVEGSACIFALWSGFGPTLKYAIAWAERTSPTSVGLRYGSYHGIGPGTPWVLRQTGCGGLIIGTGGLPALGTNFSVGVTGPASYTTKGILVGIPTQLPIPGCGTCVLGVDGFAELTDTLNLAVPCNAALFGGVISFQGFGLGGGTCFGTLGLSNTYDVTVR